VLKLLGAVHWVDGYHHRVNPQNGKVRNHPLRAVLQIKQHPVALANAQAVQRGSQAFGLLQHLAISQCLVKKHQRRLAWKAQCAYCQVMPQRCLRWCDGERQPLRPKFVMQIVLDLRLACRVIGGGVKGQSRGQGKLQTE